MKDRMRVVFSCSEGGEKWSEPRFTLKAELARFDDRLGKIYLFGLSN